MYRCNEQITQLDRFVKLESCNKLVLKSLYFQMLHNYKSWYYKMTVNLATHFHGCMAVRIMLYVIIF